MVTSLFDEPRRLRSRLHRQTAHADTKRQGCVRAESFVPEDRLSQGLFIITNRKQHHRHLAAGAVER
jgi:hypothetical protein